MRWRGLAYSAHDPRWGWEPLAGRGAAASCGRFNAFGTRALYLALTIEGLFAEIAQGLPHRLDALTVHTVDVDMDDLVDLRGDAGRYVAGVALEDLACGWARLPGSGVPPPSWTIAQRLVKEGASGLLVPSFAVGAKPDAANLVLFRWGEAPHLVALVTPADPAPRKPAKAATAG